MKPRRLLANASIFAVLAGCTSSTPGALNAPRQPKGEAASAPARSMPLADPPAADEAPGLPSRVVHVTVYSDRAQVTREAQVTTQSEAQVVVLGGLPGWVDDGSVRVGIAQGQILDVRVDRTFLATPKDARWQKVRDELQTLQGELSALSDEIAILDAQKAQIEGLKNLSQEKFGQGVTVGTIDIRSYGELLTFVRTRLRETAKDRRALVEGQQRIAPLIAAKERELAELESLGKLEETRVTVSYKGAPGQATSLELSYMIPGVTWEPAHEVRAAGSGVGTASVSSFAIVSQTSGEDWSGADIAFSTQSTTEMLRIPEIETLALGETHTSQATMTSKASSYQRAQSAYASQNAQWNALHRKSGVTRQRFEESYKSNVEYLEVVQQKTVSLFETLRDRGTTAHFTAQAGTTVRGDGHPARLALGGTELQATAAILAVPEKSLNAARTLRMTNSSGRALLPGKVSLYLQGTFVGVTEIEFVAQGEEFSVFLGVADQIKISRALDRKQSGLVRNRQSRLNLSFVITAQNLSEDRVELSLADRIPVSENTEIRVSRVRVTPEADPDPRGILRWSVALGPGETREFRVSYQIDYPPALILRTRGGHPARSPSPSADAPLEQQLLHYESNL